MASVRRTDGQLVALFYDDGFRHIRYDDGVFTDRGVSVDSNHHRRGGSIHADDRR